MTSDRSRGAAKVIEAETALGARDFDFWLGEWEVSWDDRRGTNVIEPIFDGRVILEQFDGHPGADFRGMSVSVYDESARVWRQTWVDSEGNYLQFTGSFGDGVMDLRGERSGDLVRMQWRDIRSDALTWLWQRSEDGGESWVTMWELAYRRRSR
jgi:hypothetical protein